MTSIGKTSGVMKREVSHMEDMAGTFGGDYKNQFTDDVMSSTSGVRDKDLKDSAHKV